MLAYQEQIGVTYKVHIVRFNGRRTHILCHGHDPTHPCPPLIAVCNYFLLSKPSSIKLGEGHSISQYDLVQKLRHLLDKTLRDDMEKYPEEYKRNPGAIGIPRIAQAALLQDTVIKPFNTKGNRDFAATSHLSFYRFLKIPLHHEWIVDPRETRVRREIGAMSSDQLMALQNENNSVIQKFLDGSRSQLTAYGITRLTEALGEGELAALYREEHISLIYKHNGTVYVLETDMDRLDKSPGAMWKTLNLVDEDEVFTTSEFVPLAADKQPNEKGKKWVEDREKEAKTFEEELLEQGKKNRTDKQNKRIKKKK